MTSLKVIPISGGYDSTLLLHQFLLSGESCVAHHVHLITSEGLRYSAEAKAYREIIDELRKMHGEFINTTSTHKQLNPTWYGWDLLTATFHAAVATEGHLYLLGPRDVELCLAIPKEDVRFDRNHDVLQDRVEALWGSFFTHMGVHSKVSYPISHMSKGEIVEALPARLRFLCWTCRRPIDGVTPCGQCSSCRRVGGLNDSSRSIQG